MLRTATSACLLGLSLAGCWGGPESEPNVEPADTVDAINALTRGLRFDGSERQSGELPTGVDGSVELFAPDALLQFEPGSAGNLVFELSDPTDEFPEAILIHFEYASEHLVIPTSGESTPGLQHVESAYTLDDGVCAKLCADRLYAFEMSLTVRFATDRVAPAVVRPVALDCRGAGDPMYCPEDDNAAQSGAGGVGGVGGAGISGGSGFGGRAGVGGTGAFGGTG